MTDISPERIERAARAICLRALGGSAPQSAVDRDWPMFALDAKAALTCDASAIEGARADEREACARIADQSAEADRELLGAREINKAKADCSIPTAEFIAAKIRSRTPVAAEADKGWRTMESAPTDGTQCLLYCVPNEVPSLRPHLTAGYWQKSDGFLKPGFWRFNHSVGPSFKPTHWQPLPSPPSISSEGV